MSDLLKYNMHKNRSIALNMKKFLSILIHFLYRYVFYNKWCYHSEEYPTTNASEQHSSSKHTRNATVPWFNTAKSNHSLLVYNYYSYNVDDGTCIKIK